ncbi:tape measure protein [Vibrio cholerae]
MNQNLVFALRFDAKTGQFVTNVGAASRAVGELGDRSGISTKQLHTLDQQSSQLSSQLVSLRNQALALAGGFSIMAVAGDATRTLAQYQDMRTQITALVGGQREWGETEQYLIATASEHNKVLTSMAGNYARLASLQEAGLLTVDEMRHIFEGMSDVQSQTGASTVQLEQSMYGLSQALAYCSSGRTQPSR